MKSTEMIFLDNESLWEAIEKYAAAQSLLDRTHDQLEHDSELEEPQKEYDDAKNALLLMLGLPNESKPSLFDLYGEKKNGRTRMDISIPKIPNPAIEESGGQQDGELWTNWVRTYWLDTFNPLPYENPNGKTVYPSKAHAVQEALASAQRLGSIRHKISHDYDIDENLNVVLIEWHTKEKK